MIKQLATFSVAALLLVSVSVVAIPTESFATGSKATAPGQVKKNPAENSVEVVIGTQSPAAETESKVSVDVSSEEVAVNVANKVAVSVQSEKKTTDHKVTICHRTNSATNPYVKITVDKNAVDGVSGNSQGDPHDHYGEHQGPVATSKEVAAQLKKDKIEWGDIIPPVSPHAGLNWNAEGRAIYDNGCNFATPPAVESATIDSGKGSTPGTLPTTGSDAKLIVLAALAATVGTIIYMVQAIRARLTAGL